KLRHRSRLTAFQHGYELAEFDSIRVRLDLNGLGWQLGCRSRVSRFPAVRIHVVNRDMWVGNGRLLQVLIDAASPAHETSLELDGYSRTAAQFVMMMRL